MLVFGRFELQPERHRLLLDSQPLAIGARAFDVLPALAERRDRVVTESELMDLVWPGLVVEESNLQVQIGALRKLLGSDAIATIPGRGYRTSSRRGPFHQGQPRPGVQPDRVCRASAVKACSGFLRALASPGALTTAA